jgi:hypothetical protein
MPSWLLSHKYLQCLGNIYIYLSKSAYHADCTQHFPVDSNIVPKLGTTAGNSGTCVLLDGCSWFLEAYNNVMKHQLLHHSNSGDGRAQKSEGELLTIRVRLGGTGSWQEGQQETTGAPSKLCGPYQVQKNENMLQSGGRKVRRKRCAWQSLDSNEKITWTGSTANLVTPRQLECKLCIYCSRLHGCLGYVSAECPPPIYMNILLCMLC